MIDGRANFVDIADAIAVPEDGGVVNRISGLGVLDFVAVTGRGLNEGAASGSGFAWSTERELVTNNLLVDFNGADSGVEATIDETDFVSLVSDFATANGGRGGDAYTQVGHTIGNISVSTGNNDLGEADSLVISTNVADAPPANLPNDTLRANIGHAAFQFSDSGGEYLSLIHI